jgi:hypothetical protein
VSSAVFWNNFIFASAEAKAAPVRSSAVIVMFTSLAIFFASFQWPTDFHDLQHADDICVLVENTSLFG